MKITIYAELSARYYRWRSAGEERGELDMDTEAEKGRRAVIIRWGLRGAKLPEAGKVNISGKWIGSDAGGRVAMAMALVGGELARDSYP